jgi:hypothetical protein
MFSYENLYYSCLCRYEIFSSRLSSGIELWGTIIHGSATQFPTLNSLNRGHCCVHYIIMKTLLTRRNFSLTELSCDRACHGSVYEQGALLMGHVTDVGGSSVVWNEGINVNTEKLFRKKLNFFL